MAEEARRGKQVYTRGQCVVSQGRARHEGKQVYDREQCVVSQGRTRCKEVSRCMLESNAW